jgi:hypothetical protein
LHIRFVLWVTIRVFVVAKIDIFSNQSDFWCFLLPQNHSHNGSCRQPFGKPMAAASDIE